MRTCKNIDRFHQPKGATSISINRFQLADSGMPAEVAKTPLQPIQRLSQVGLSHHLAPNLHRSCGEEMGKDQLTDTNSLETRRDDYRQGLPKNKNMRWYKKAVDRKTGVQEPQENRTSIYNSFGGKMCTQPSRRTSHMSRGSLE